MIQKPFGYCDVNFISDIDDKKSTNGNIFLFGGTYVSQLNKKQVCIAKSIMEAEYISYSIAVSTVVWTKRFIDNLQPDLYEEPINLFCNNKSAIFLVKSGANSSKGKHIDIDYHYIHDIVRGEK